MSSEGYKVKDAISVCLQSNTPISDCECKDMSVLVNFFFRFCLVYLYNKIGGTYKSKLKAIKPKFDSSV